MLLGVEVTKVRGRSMVNLGRDRYETEMILEERSWRGRAVRRRVICDIVGGFGKQGITKGLKEGKRFQDS